VCEINAQLAGFFMVTGLNDQTGMERELHAVATSKQYRGLGIGSVLVDFFCDHYYGRKLYAAVMPDSQMYTMLKRRGFYLYANSSTGYIVVERESRPREKGLMPRASSETTDMAISTP
jgi:ribosomal protein S18 acetylase RimI-like enzyme